MAIFLVVAPIIVMNAWGYRFDFQHGVFVHSGTITLKTNPQNFNVYIDGEPEPSKQTDRINSSNNITGLLPKSYDLTVSADGFQTWRKNTEVHSGISTEFWNILLVKNNYSHTPYATGGIDKFFISPKNDFIAFVKSDDSGSTIKIISINDKTISSAFSFPGWQFTDDSREENIEWSPNGDYISIPLKRTLAATPEKVASEKITTAKDSAPATETKTENAYFIGNPDNKNILNLNDIVNKNDLKNVRWDPRDKNYLFFLSEYSLYRANINDQTDPTRIADNVSSFDISKTGIYYTQMPTELVFRTNLDGKSGLTQITNNFPEELSSPNNKLIVFDDMRIAFLNTNKNLYIFNRGDLNTYFRKLGSNVSGMQFSNDGKKLLFWTDNGISTYFLRQWSVQPERFENEVQDITRYSDQIRNVQWFKDYEHVIFNTGQYTKIIELDARDHRVSMDLLKTNTASPSIVYNNYLERLFFTDSEKNASDIYSITFPEPGGFLGLFPPPAQQ